MKITITTAAQGMINGEAIDLVEGESYEVTSQSDIDVLLAYGFDADNPPKPRTRKRSESPEEIVKDGE